MGIGSLGMSELVVIFVIVLVFFGPRRFPEIARSMGSAMREFRRSLNQIQRELEEVDPRKDIPGKDLLDEFRKGKPGNWLDPNRSGTSSSATPGARSAAEVAGPQVTGEAAGSAPPVTEPSRPPGASVTAESASTSRDEATPGADGGEQLPMFDGGSSGPSGADLESPGRPDPDTEPPAPPTDGSRSG
jgi:sec-independent protein translocase protein TatA